MHARALPPAPQVGAGPLHAGELSTLQFGELERCRELGRGNSSRVWLATHTPSGKRCAMKVLNERNQNLALNEARAHRAHHTARRHFV